MRPWPEAIAWAEAQTRFSPDGLCLKFTRTCYHVSALWSDAATGWANADLRHLGNSTPPRGVPVWWTGGSNGYGHVAISAGGGYVISTDYPSSEKVGRARIDALTKGWNLRYGGWSEDINGVRVWTLPPPGDDLNEQDTRRVAREEVSAVMGVARDFVMHPTQPGKGYLLDYRGGVHPVGDLPGVQGGPYWSFDAARALEIIEWSDDPNVSPKGYVLDFRGGRHPFGGAPPANPGPYW